MCSKPLVVVEDDAVARVALQKLAATRVSGLPVVDASGVMVADVTMGDLRELATIDLSDDDVDALLSQSILDYVYAARRVRESREHREGLRNRGDLLRPVVVHAEDSLGMAIELLCEAKLHRLTIVDAAGRPTAVLSLTDVLHIVGMVLSLQ
jgi:CBS-domain-containing membrane protein